MVEQRRAGERPDAETAFRLSRRTFMAGERLDMQSLAQQLDVDRTTLYRWLGNRDQLIVDIIISLADPTIDNLEKAAPGTGGSRIAWIAGSYAQLLIDAPYYRRFLRRDAERALRLTTTKASRVQQHVVGRFERLLEREQDRGHLDHAMQLHDLAYLIVRIMESFIYSDIIAGEQPDAKKVEAAVAALLHVP